MDGSQRPDQRWRTCRVSLDLINGLIRSPVYNNFPMMEKLSFWCYGSASPRMRKSVVSEEEAPAMQKFFQEIADLKPVRFTAEQLDGFTKHYSKSIGSGGYGKVYKGEFPNGVKIAVKVLTEKTNVRQSFTAEVGTIGRIHHRNLVRLYGYCYDPSLKALVYEFMENGSLDKHLFTDHGGGGLPWPKLQEIAVGTAKGLAYLHEECKPSIIHYDIKPGNILLDSNFCPKVADFGLANLCNVDGSHARLVGCRGTPGYLAPEFIMMNSPISNKCDVYSFGILLFEIVGRRKNTRVCENSYSLDWFPKKVWEEYDKGELSALMDMSGVAEEYRSAAERAAVVALWCVQDWPEARPEMRAVVKMLEGRVEVLPPPPRPFTYLFSLEKEVLPPSSELESGDGESTDLDPESVSGGGERVLASFSVQSAKGDE